MARNQFASIGQASDRGRWRKQNEDAARVDAAAALLVVADGMGGHPCGEVASQVAANAVAQSAGDVRTPLGEALATAHATVVQAAGDGRGAPGMGTTCVACRLGADGLEVAWVGDSRAYRLRAGAFEALTRDHTEVGLLLEQGALTPQQAASHPGGHMLARALGIGALERNEVGERTLPAAPGDRLLLCSDGLTGEVDDARIEALLAAHPDDQEAADALMRAALDAGGRDNVTLVVATVG